MIYLILQQLIIVLLFIALGIFTGWVLWGTRARAHAQDRAELAAQHKIMIGLQDQIQQDKRRITELEIDADSARKLAAKKESSVSQLIADKGSLLADVRTLEKEIAKLKAPKG